MIVDSTLQLGSSTITSVRINWKVVVVESWNKKLDKQKILAIVEGYVLSGEVHVQYMYMTVHGLSRLCHFMGQNIFSYLSRHLSRPWKMELRCITGLVKNTFIYKNEDSPNKIILNCTLEFCFIYLLITVFEVCNVSCRTHFKNWPNGKACTNSALTICHRYGNTLCILQL